MLVSLIVEIIVMGIIHAVMPHVCETVEIGMTVGIITFNFVAVSIPFLSNFFSLSFGFCSNE
jgi:hypothetical protein